MKKPNMNIPKEKIADFCQRWKIKLRMAGLKGNIRQVPINSGTK